MQISFFQSLRFRIPSLVLLGVIPPILIGIVYGSNRVDKIIEANFENQQSSKTEALAENVSRWTIMNILALQNLSRQPAIISLNATLQKPLLEEFVKTYNHLYLVSTIGLDGMNIARNDHKPLTNYSSRFYFKQAKAGKNITWEALVGKTSKKTAACLSTPIRQENTVVGVIQGCSNLEEIAQQVGAVKIGKTGYAIIVDNKGQVVAHPDPAFATGDKLADFSQFPPVKSLLEGKKGHFDFTDKDGKQWLSYSTFIENGWGVIIVQEKAEAFLQKQEFQQAVWTISLIIVTLITLIVFFITNRLVDPLTRLTKASSAFATGNLKQNIDIDRNDEIGILADSYNKMAGQIQESIINIESKAEEQKQQKETLEKEIIQLIDELQNAVDGDLTVRASLSSMEMSTVADLFNAIIDSLSDIAIQVKQSSTEVSSSLGENEQSIQLLAQQAFEETKQAQNTLNSVEAMSHSIEEVATNANQATTFADYAYKETQASTSAMDETVNSIVDLQATVGETAKKMKDLEESSQKIVNMVSLIEEIALKANLLAINASRAGDQGQEFKVFGEQLAILGEQSAVATKEITNIVTNIQLETQEVSQAMEKGNFQALNTTRLVESTKERLAQVLEHSYTINELMRSVSEATISQTDTSQLITQLVQQIAQQSEQRLHSSENLSQSMHTTANIAKELESAVERFKVK
ncbi:MAG: HAMP domain-containing protein [Cyanobacteria bacterium]|nr:HAMP domain-containing protein [Cyanobacteria bacterium CG_2015-09_32_10]